MPRVISDELYESLMGCVREKRLLGVMGFLERLEKEAIRVAPLVPEDKKYVYYLGEKSETKTNSN